MVEASLEPDVRPWPGILTQPRRAMRMAADGRLWAGPTLAYIALALGMWLLATQTGAPPREWPPITGSDTGDILLGLAVVAFFTVLLPWGLGRLRGGQATLSDCFIVLLWSEIPLLALLPITGLGVALHGPAWWTMQGSLSRSEALFALPPTAIALKLALQGVAIWCGGLYVAGLSEVQGFTPRRVLLQIVIPIVALGVIAAIAAVVLVAQLEAPGR